MSEKQSQTSRSNGAKSHGPVTPEGRAKSARNALRHGLRSRQIVLPTESDHEFDRLHRDCLDQFLPQTGYERELVDTIAIARWRLRRIMTMESSLLANQLTLNKGAIEREFEDLSPGGRTAYVFRSIAVHSGLTLPLLLRYEGAANRTHDRALKHLQALQTERRGPQPNPPAPPPAPLDPPPPTQTKTTIRTQAPSPGAPSFPQPGHRAAAHPSNEPASKPARSNVTTTREPAPPKPAPPAAEESNS